MGGAGTDGTLPSEDLGPGTAKASTVGTEASKTSGTLATVTEVTASSASSLESAVTAPPRAGRVATAVAAFTY